MSEGIAGVSLFCGGFKMFIELFRCCSCIIVPLVSVVNIMTKTQTSSPLSLRRGRTIGCMKKGSTSDGLVFHAGFPNAGEDRAGLSISLDDHVFRHRLSTYLWRLDTDMPELGWRAGSTIVVDRALEPRQNDLVVAVVEESFVVRKLHQGRLYDAAGRLDESEQIAVWGVITHALQEYRSA